MNLYPAVLPSLITLKAWAQAAYVQLYWIANYWDTHFFVMSVLIGNRKHSLIMKKKGNYADTKPLFIHIFHLNVLIPPELFMTKLFIKKIPDDNIRFPSSTDISFWESATAVPVQITA